MCGIFGVWHQDHQAVDLLRVQRATNGLRHRGPDDEGYLLVNTQTGRLVTCGGLCTDQRLNLPGIDNFFGEHFDLAFGYRRLSILDLSPAGHQPMCSSDGRFWIIFNGEVYNFREERRLLEKRGHVFHSASDTEVILHLYQEYGEECVNYLRGMFSFAIWDNKKRTLFAARDRLGIKPFLYANINNKFMFSSELKAILSSGMLEREVDPIAVQEFLFVGSVQPPNTMIKNVKALLPGQFLHSSIGQLKESSYWDIGHEPVEYFRGSFEDARDQLLELLNQSIKEQMVSDVPLGAFLSGGLDSAVVVSLMNANAVGKIKTFTIGFNSPDVLLDESAQARSTARYYNTDHHTLIVSDRDVANSFDHFVLSLDQPSIDGLNTYFVSKFARQDVTVSLSGLGADEIFAGYSRTWQILNQSPSIIGNCCERFLNWECAKKNLSNTPIRLRRKIKAIAAQNSALGTYSLSRTVFWPDDMEGAFNDKYFLDRTIPNDTAKSVIGKCKTSNALDLVQMASRLDIKTYMAAQLLRDMDAVSMAHSLEVRFPLIDHRIVEFGFSLPIQFKYTGNRSARAEENYQNGVKRILFDAMQTNLPPSLGSRKKAGFNFPFERWLRNGLSEQLNDEFLSSQITSPFSLSWRRSVNNLFQTHHISSTQIWSLLIFQKWYNQTLQI